MDRPLTIRLLRAPEITWQSRPYSVPRRQTRALLYRLAAAMEPLSREQLLLLFWPDKPDLQARRSLTRLISSLRAALPQPDLLLTDTAAVSLNSQLAGSDSAAFFQLAGQESEAAWEVAAALVGGSFLDGFVLSGSPEFDSWQMMTQQQVEQRYLLILAKLVDAKVAGGDLAAAIHYANQYLAVDDLAETIHCRLITLYARTGERQEAMRQFEACVLALERELGVGPLPETRAAFEAAQLGEFSSGQAAPQTAPQPQWHTLPSLDLPLIGRKREEEKVEAALRQAKSGGVVFISGEPGIGKSRLMQAVASAQEATILLGHCRQATQSLPYQPLVEALRTAVPFTDFSEGVQSIWLAETARLLPELKERYPHLPQAMDAPQAQVRQFEALAQVLLGLAARRPLLICLDDLHWADETTLDWLQFIALRLGGSGLRLLATYRTEEAGPLAALQRTLHRSGAMAEVRLGALSEVTIAVIVGQVSEGHLPPDLSGRIYRRTGGNTFFVLETVRDLLEQDLLENPPQPLPVPLSVLQTVQRRVARLSPLAQQLLDAAAVLAANLTFDVLQATTGRSDLEVGDGLDELLRRQLLAPEGGGFRFQHDLVQTAVTQQLAPWRRRLLNRRAGEALERLRRQDLDAAAAQIAHHYDEAGEITAAISYYERAATFAQRVYANHEAVQYFERALDLLLDESVADRLDSQLRLYEGLGQVLRRQASYDRAEQAFKSMHTAANQLGDPSSAAQAWLRLGQVQDSQKQFADSLQSALNAKALAAADGLDATFAYALYAEAWALFRLDRLDEALPVAQEAVARSKQLNDRELMAHSRNTLGAIYKYQGHYQLSEQHQQLALELFEKTGDTRRVAGMLNNLGETARLRHDYAQAYEFYCQAVAIAGQIGERDWLVEFLTNLALSQSALGQLRAAEMSLNEALEVAQDAKQEGKTAELSQLLNELKAKE